MSSLVNKLKYVGRIGVASAVFYTGCIEAPKRELNPFQLGGLVLGGAAPYAKDPRAGAAAANLSQAALAIDQNEARRESGATVNVYVQGQQPPKYDWEIRYYDSLIQKAELGQQLSTNPYFVCNKWIDDLYQGGKDEKVDILEVEGGLKKEFVAGEEIRLVTWYKEGREVKGKKWRRIIAGPNGDTIGDDTMLIPRNNIIIGIGPDDDLAKFLLAHGGIGEYNVDYYLDGKRDGSTKFGIRGN